MTEKSCGLRYLEHKNHWKTISAACLVLWKNSSWSQVTDAAAADDDDDDDEDEDEDDDDNVFQDQLVHLQKIPNLKPRKIGDIGPRLAESVDVAAYGPSCCTCLASWSSQGGLNGWK